MSDFSLAQLSEQYKSRQQKCNTLRMQIHRAKVRLEKLDTPWYDQLVAPIAVALGQRYPQYRFVMGGPYGLACRVIITAYPVGAEGTYTNSVGCLDFELNAHDSTLMLVNYTTPTGEFASGTLGAINGLNFPVMPLPDTFDELCELFEAEMRQRQEVVNAPA